MFGFFIRVAVKHALAEYNDERERARRREKEMRVISSALCGLMEGITNIYLEKQKQKLKQYKKS